MSRLTTFALLALGAAIWFGGKAALGYDFDANSAGWYVAGMAVGLLAHWHAERRLR